MTDDQYEILEIALVSAVPRAYSQPLDLEELSKVLHAFALRLAMVSFVKLDEALRDPED